MERTATLQNNRSALGLLVEVSIWNPASSRRRQHNKATRLRNCGSATKNSKTAMLGTNFVMTDRPGSRKFSTYSTSRPYATPRKMSGTTIESKRTVCTQQREADTQPTGPCGKNPTDRVLNTRGARRTDKQRTGKDKQIR